ncbi:FAD-binding oxidoreductase [Streptomyces sp. NPDC058701]|uniref:FAD-binding oxidoreductase n=1 Tax=Streptomyces sp. NPDC058701 TaxID=3346608 RepID=UPI00365D080E
MLIAQCMTEADVARAVRFATRRDVPIAVRGGGHSIPGHSTCEGGIVIDLGLMRDVLVDPARARARAQGGCRLADLDRATQEHGLAVTTGAVSHTGLGGLTLGGGFGLLMRTYGLTIDNLSAARLVTADGDLVRVAEDCEPELFWALRGGGGNFGIVTEFEFRLHRVGPVRSLIQVHPLADAREVLSVSSRLPERADDRLAWGHVMREAPDFPWMPRHIVGRRVLLSAFSWLGGDDGDALDEVAASVAAGSLHDPVFSMTAVQPYVAVQSAWDGLFAPGHGVYSKAALFREASDHLIDALVEQSALARSPLSQIELTAMGGAVARVPDGATAFPHREAGWVANVVALWTVGDPAAGDHVEWVRKTRRAAVADGCMGTYVNYGDGEAGETDRSYGTARARLGRVKDIYDPHNRFRLNQNIRPTSYGR